MLSTLVKPITTLYYIASIGVTWALIFSGFLFIFSLHFVVMGLGVWIWGSGALLVNLGLVALAFRFFGVCDSLYDHQKKNGAGYAAVGDSAHAYFNPFQSSTKGFS